MEGNFRNDNIEENKGNSSAGSVNASSANEGNSASSFNSNSVSGSASNSNSSSAGGASGSIYSYSYLNQGNQERNPNYYEKKEEERSSAEAFAQARRTADTDPAGTGSGTYSGGSQYGRTYGGNAEGGQAYQRGYSQSYSYGQASGGQQNPYGQAYGGQWDASGSQSGKKRQKKAKMPKMPKIKRPHGFGRTVAKCAALAVVFGLVSSAVFYGTGIAVKKAAGVSDVQQAAESSQESGAAEKKAASAAPNSGSLAATGVSSVTTVEDVSDIVDNVMPSIVAITNMGQDAIQDFFGRTYVQDTESAGSGIIIGQTEDEIYIATNNHVVANSNELTVNFIDDQTVAAEIKGTDSSTDLAVLSVKVKDIPEETMDQIKVATLGSSEEIKVGQSAIAIGNALGYGQSVTTGVISAVDREVTVSDEMTGTSVTNDLIQTDAAINPGNSGGALLNVKGEVIGINSVKYSDTEVEGMGYAIPISAAEPIINNLITREVVADIGVAGQDITSDLAKNFGMPEGLYITQVTANSAAEQAGIKKGDIITKFDGRAVKGLESLSEIMQYYAAGTEVEVTIQTNQNGEWQEQTVSVVLGRKND